MESAMNMQLFYFQVLVCIVLSTGMGDLSLQQIVCKVPFPCSLRDQRGATGCVDIHNPASKLRGLITVVLQEKSRVRGGYCKTT
jgi:hypothetical protein